MRPRHYRAVTAAALATLLAPAGVVEAALAAQPGGTRTAVESLAPEHQEGVAVYLRDFPQMTEQQAVQAVLGQGGRTRLLEQLQLVDPDGFGGGWYDPPSDTQHLNTTSAAAAQQARQRAAGLGVGSHIVTHPVRFSYQQLVATMDRINAGNDPTLRAQGAGRARLDVSRNQVAVGLTDPQLAALAAAGSRMPAPVVLRPAPPAPADEVQDVCLRRTACGVPLRSGIVLWYEDVFGQHNACSLGFTARGSDGSRWAITAGHCVRDHGGIGVRWGHGEQPIGPARQWFDDAADRYDVARIRIDSSYWRSVSGGYFFNARNPSQPLDVQGRIVSRGSIQVGHLVCLSAWFSEIGVACGRITDTSRPTDGKPVVAFDACGGDSGGGWYWLAGGERTAYGIHSSSSSGCHSSGGRSAFTALPDMDAIFDANSDAFIRVEHL